MKSFRKIISITICFLIIFTSVQVPLPKTNIGMRAYASGKDALAIRHMGLDGQENLFQYNGTASYTMQSSSEAIEVFSGEELTGGSVFTKEKIHLNDDMSFSTYFIFEIRGNGDPQQDNMILIDGLTFTLQADSNTAYNSLSPKSMGAEGISPSISIEFDTRYDGADYEEGTADKHHVAVYANGNYDQPIAKAVPDVNAYLLGSFLINHIYNTWIEYDGVTNTLDIHSEERTSPILTVNVDLESIFTADDGSRINDVYAGFTASTGDYLATGEEGILTRPVIWDWFFKNDADPIPNLNNADYCYEASIVSLESDMSHDNTSSILTAAVTDAQVQYNPVGDINVNFLTSFGTLSQTSVMTDVYGEASVTLTSLTSGTANVKAFAEGGALGEKVVQLENPAGDAIVIEADEVWLMDALVLNGNSALDNVKSDLYMPTSGESGSTISWTSGNTVFIAQNGDVTRPTYEQGDQDIVISAVISKGLALPVEKTFNMTVKAADLNDTQAVLADYTWLTEDRILGSNSSVDNITVNMNLPEEGLNGSLITWSSSDTSVVTTKGTVNRPTYTEGDKKVTLSVEISKEDAQPMDKTFTVTVKAAAMTDTEAVTRDHVWLTDTQLLNGNTSLDSVIQNLSLPTAGSNGSTISWESSKEALVDSDGTVLRPSYTEGDKQITLTATISKGDAQVEKTIDVTVKAADITDAEALALTFTWLDSDRILFSNSDLNNIIDNLYLPDIYRYELGTDDYTTISWTSSDPNVISLTGGVTRPVYGQGDSQVTLTADISKGSVEQDKTFNVTVKEAVQTDEQVVTADNDWLTIDMILGNNTGQDNITQSLSLPTSGPNGSSISWKSYRESLILPDGTVTRPSYNVGDLTADIRAYISKGSAATQTKAFTFTVIALHQTDEDAVTSDYNWLTKEMFLNGNSDNKILGDLYMPQNGPNGTSIIWESTNQSVAALDGTINRPSYDEGDKLVTITAVVSRGSEESNKKTFDLLVRALDQKDKDAIDEDYNWLTTDVVLSENSSLDDITDSLYMPEYGPNGSEIKWVSTDENVVAQDGTVSNTSGVKDVTITAYISKGSEALEKTFQLKVFPTDIQAVALDLEWLTVEKTLGENTSRNSLRYDLTLPDTGPHGTKITWSATYSKVLSHTGKVTRLDDSHMAAGLYAYLRKGTVEDKKYFMYSVLSKSSDAPYVTGSIP